MSDSSTNDFACIAKLNFIRPVGAERWPICAPWGLAHTFPRRNVSLPTGRTSAGYQHWSPCVPRRLSKPKMPFPPPARRLANVVPQRRSFFCSPRFTMNRRHSRPVPQAHHLYPKRCRRTNLTWCLTVPLNLGARPDVRRHAAGYLKRWAPGLTARRPTKTFLNVRMGEQPCRGNITFAGRFWIRRFPARPPHRPNVTLKRANANSGYRERLATLVSLRRHATQHGQRNTF